MTERGREWLFASKVGTKQLKSLSAMHLMHSMILTTKQALMKDDVNGIDNPPS
jgi:hypothetical protein